MSTLLEPATEVCRRAFPFRARQDGADTNTTIAGHASVWGSLNSYGEVFVPGAYSRTLTEKSDTKPLVMGFYHREAIGRWTRYEEDQHGLFLEGPVSQTTAGKDAAILANDGVLTGLSIGFWPTRYQFAEPGEQVTFSTANGDVSYSFDEWVVYILEAELVEASLVMAPADDDARLTHVRDALQKAERVLPAVSRDTDVSWEDAAYSMALLMGGRGAGAFSDLPPAQHRSLYERVEQIYEAHGKTAPPYERSPEYAKTPFQHDERDVFTDRYLSKTLASVVAGCQGVSGPLSAETRAKAVEAVAALDPLTRSPGEKYADLLAGVNAVRNNIDSIKETHHG